MKAIRDTSSPPQGRLWTYKDFETGYIIQHSVYRVLLNEAKKYRQLNNLPVGLQFQEQFDAILCEHAPGSCHEWEPPSLATKASNLVKAFARHAASGFKMRTPDETEVILGLCRVCDYYGGERGFFKVVCKKCGCSGKKAAMATEHCPIGKW